MRLKPTFVAALLAAALAPAAYAAEPAAGSIWTEPNTNIEFVYVPGGCFNMGSKLGTPDANPNERPVHQVCLKGFYLSKYEITQAQYKLVLNSNPSHFSGDSRPVEKVSWDDAQGFIKELNLNTGDKFALPSEAQWEYACRAGGNETYCGGNDLGSVAWYDNNSESTTHSVGQKRPNAWGLYDMSGNVWEWVQDCWNDNYSGAPADGSARETGNCAYRVLRGGSWGHETQFARAALRLDNDPAFRNFSFGFRLARTLP